jgi:hypothetical protein
MMTIRSSLCGVVGVCSLLIAAVPLAAAADAQATGVVKVGGKPLVTGKVTFYQRNGQFVGAKVENGRYSIDHLPAGTSGVTIEGKGVPRQYTSQNTSPVVVQSVEGATNTFVFELEEGRRGVPLPEDDPLLQAIQERFGEPDRVTGSGRLFLQYRLQNGDTLTLIVSGDRVIGIDHATIE